MATDATGTPTPKGIPKYNTAVDVPSGKGFNAAMDAIDALIPSGTVVTESIVDAKGDILAATAADDLTRLAVGSNGQVLTADSAEATGIKWAAPASGITVVNRNHTDVPVSNTTTETSIFSTTVTGNSMGANGRLDLRIIGNIRGTAAISGVLTVRLKWGGSTVVTWSSASYVNNTVIQPQVIEAQISNENATNAQICLMGATGDPGDAGVFGARGWITPATATQDTTSDKTLEVTVQWDVANATNTYNKLSAELTLLT